MKLKLIAIVTAVLLGAATLASAAEFVSNKDGSVNIISGQHHNLYAASNTVNVAAPVTGDLLAAGNSVTVSGNVESNLEAAGNSITVNGSVGRNARLAGRNLDVTGSVGGDLLAAGSTIRINGSVAGDVVAAGKKLTFGPNANVTGHIKYYGPNSPVVEEGAKVGTIEHISPKAHDFRRANRALHGFGLMVGFLAWLLAAIAITLVFPRRVHAVVSNASNKFWWNLLVGFLFFILGPLAVVLLFLILIGYYAAFIVLLAWLLVAAVACIISSIWLGSLILSWYRKSGHVVNVAAAVVGVIAFQLIELIPILGWLVIGIIYLMVVGSVLRFIMQDIKANR